MNVSLNSVYEQVFSNELLVSKIFEGNPFKDVLHFESVAKLTRQATHMCWQNLCYKERFTVAWSSDTSISRARYLCGKALFKHIHNFPKANQIQDAYERYCGLMQAYPVFGVYLWTEMNFIAPVKGIKPTFCEYNEFWFNSSNAPGGWLLRALAATSSRLVVDNKGVQLSYMNWNVREAINKGSVCASYLLCKVIVMKLIDSQISPQVATMLIGLAAKTFVKYGDFKAIELLIDFDPSFGHKFYQAKVFAAPVFAFMGKYSYEIQAYRESSYFYDLAFSAFGDSISRETLKELVLVKYMAHEWKSVLAHLEIISAHGYEITADLLIYKALAQIELRELDPANRTLNEVLSIFGSRIPGDIYAKVALAKRRINLFEEASFLYDRAVVEYGDQATLNLLIDAGDIKLCLEEIEEAEYYYSRAILLYKEHLRAYMWANAGGIYVKLRRWGKAERCFHQAALQYGNQVPSQVVKAAAYVSRKLVEEVIAKYNLHLIDD